MATTHLSVRTYIKCRKGRAMAQVVSRRPLTAEAWVRARVGLVVDKVALGQVFLRVLRFPLSVYHSTVALQTHIIWGMRNMLT
jgi:hypothetical protein